MDHVLFGAPHVVRRTTCRSTRRVLCQAGGTWNGWSTRKAGCCCRERGAIGSPLLAKSSGLRHRPLLPSGTLSVWACDLVSSLNFTHDFFCVFATLVGLRTVGARHCRFILDFDSLVHSLACSRSSTARCSVLHSLSIYLLRLFAFMLAAVCCFGFAAF
jgi:hypothetical protein